MLRNREACSASSSVAWAVGLLVCVGVVGGEISPVWAAAPGRAAEATPAAGGFAVGDGVEGFVDERSGALSFELAAGGIALAWDSRLAGVDRFGFGEGWSIGGVGSVDVRGGLRVLPASGELVEADASVPSGLSGYELGDVRFEQVAGALPARADGVAGERAYAYRLTELGGTVSYFSAAGDPVARIDAFGNRVDWEWDERAGHRLVRVVTESGVATTLDWSDPGRVVVSTAVGARAPVRSVVAIEHGRLGGVLDAVGRRSAVGYSEAGLVSRLAGASGAAMEVGWRAMADGSSAVDRIRVIDALTGEAITERSWQPGEGVASGWPLVPDASAGAAVDDLRYSTAVSDGATRVVSEYSGRHLLVERQVLVRDASGERVAHEQSYTYPEADGELPVTRPTHAAVTYLDALGAARTVEERFEFDDLGRVTSHTTADGTLTHTTFDEEPAVGGLPIGLPRSERVITPDGLVSETRYELNPARTAVTVAETFTGAADDELSRVSRTEYEVAADGFVTVEREFPQGGDGTPIVTARRKVADLAAGTETLTETVAAGTPLAATTSTVSDLAHGQPVAVRDAVGNTTTTEYDAVGRVTSIADPGGRVTTTEYRTRQRDGITATVVTAPDQLATTTESDVLGRPIRVTDNIDHGAVVPGHVRVVESRAYPAPGVVEVTDAWGATTRSEQDAFGRPVKTVAPSGLTEITLRDEVAQEETTALTPTGELADAEVVTTVRTDEGARTSGTTGTRRDGVPVPPSTTRWDGLGREVSAAGAGTTSTAEYDAFGNPVAITARPDADGTDDAAGPLVTTRAFDEFGTSVQKTLTDATGSRSAGTRVLDVLGRTQTETDAVGTTTTFVSTPDGLPAERATSAGQRTVTTYDQATRLPTGQVTTSPGGEAVSAGFEYDPLTDDLTGVFDPADPDGTRIAYESDAWGNPLTVTYPDGRELRYVYDAHGRRESFTDVDGNTTRYRYAATGELTGVVQEDRVGAELARAGYTYDAYGRVETLTRGNGVTTSYAYTSRSEIAAETSTDARGQALSQRRYTYSPTGTLTTRTDTVRDPDTGVARTETTRYEYDGFDRLIGSAVHEGDGTDASPRTSVEYELNVSGDLTRETSTARPGTAGAEVTVRDYAYTAAGQLTTLTTTHPDSRVTVAAQVHDAAGNLTVGHDGTRYGYDAQNRQVSETTPAGEVIRSDYWASGQRRQLSATDPGTGHERSTRFYWDGTDLVNDAHTGEPGAEPRVAAYLSGVMREARTADGGNERGTGYYGYDRHGNVTDLTDRTGAVTERSGYDDYGVRLGGQADGETTASMLVGDVSRQPFGYAGEYTDPTGGQHLEVRTYDPETRRFQQFDPADQHNPYWYGNANPITHIDPTGRAGEPDWLAIALAGAGLMLSFIGLGVAAGTAGAAIAGAGSWAAVLTGTKVALGVTIGAAALDVGIGAALAFDQAVFDVIDDDVELGLSVATLALGAMSGATGLFARFRPPKNLREAVQKFWSNWELTAWRLRHTKDGRLKAYQHTTEEGQLIRRIHEFMSGPVLDRAKSIEDIGGGLNASTLHSGDRVIGKRVRAIKVVMVRRGAGHSDSEYLIRNSMYSNLRPQEQPYVGDPITGAQLDEFMRERGITLLYIKPDPYNTAMRADWPSQPVVGQLWNRKFFQKAEGALRDARTHSRPKLNYRKDPELY